MTVKQLYEWAVQNGAADCEMVTTMPKSYVPFVIDDVTLFSDDTIELKTSGTVRKVFDVESINEEEVRNHV